MKINYDNNILIIKGDKEDLLELSSYIKKVANDKNNSHMHIDDLTLIDKESSIKELIIEKEE